MNPTPLEINCLEVIVTPEITGTIYSVKVVVKINGQPKVCFSNFLPKNDFSSHFDQMIEKAKEEIKGEVYKVFNIPK